MNTSSERFLNRLTTTGAVDTCSVGIDSAYCPTGTFSLARQHGAEQSPRSVRNAFGKVLVPDHILDFQVLYMNYVIVLNVIVRGLMQKVVSLVSDFLIFFGDLYLNKLSAVRTFLASESFLCATLKALSDFLKNRGFSTT